MSSTITVHYRQNILGQYFEFCKISDEQISLHGKTDVAASETIRICLERGVLVPFLNACQKEVHDIMRTLFNQEAVWEIERYNIREEGCVEGRQKGRTEGIQALVLSLQKFLKDQALVAKEVAEQFGLTQETAMKKVQRPREVPLGFLHGLPWQLGGKAHVRVLRLLGALFSQHILGKMI